MRRLESLGAERVDVGQTDVPWVVMADPEGNEFCVLRSRSERVHGIASALRPPVSGSGGVSAETLSHRRSSTSTTSGEGGSATVWSVVDGTDARPPARMSGWSTVAIGTVLGVFLLLLSVGGWIWWETEGAWDRVAVLAVEDGGDDRSFILLVGCFPGEIRGSASEHGDQVVVSVEVREERSENDCMTGARVTLDEPLNDRSLIDGTTGEPVPMG